MCSSIDHYGYYNLCLQGEGGTWHCNNFLPLLTYRTTKTNMPVMLYTCLYERHKNKMKQQQQSFGIDKFEVLSSKRLLWKRDEERSWAIMDCNRQYQYTVEIEKTSFQLVHLFRGDELPRRHGAQRLCGSFLEGGRWEAEPHPSLHSRSESTQGNVSARVADRQSLDAERRREVQVLDA
jgi:hypothetical protein